MDEDAEDFIVADLIEDNDTEVPDIRIWKGGDGTFSFASFCSAKETASILSGLVTHLLENEIHGERR